MKITALAALAVAALASTPALAFDTDKDGDDFQFDLVRSPAFTALNLFMHRTPNGRKSDWLLRRKIALKLFRYDSDNAQAMEIGQPRQQI